MESSSLIKNAEDQKRRAKNVEYWCKVWLNKYSTILEQIAISTKEQQYWVILTKYLEIHCENPRNSDISLIEKFVREYIIPDKLTKKQVNIIYTSEADVLNMALFGKTAKQWREENPKLKSNIKDCANVNQLVCLANLENLNAAFINKGKSQAERL